MRIFLSYPSEFSIAAEDVVLALRGAGHSIFFDRDHLEPGGDYNGVIQQELSKSDLLIFFAVAESLAVGSYTLTELELAKARWPNPEGRVLPVALNGTDVSTLPPYLRAITVLRPQGNVAAEVRHAVERLAKCHRQRAFRRVAIGFGLGMVLLASLGISLRLPPRAREKAVLPTPVPSAEEGSQLTGSNSPAVTSTHEQELIQAAASTPAATPTQKSAAPETTTTKALAPSTPQRIADTLREVDALRKERDTKCRFGPALGTRSAVNRCLSDYNAQIEFLLRQQED